MKSNLSINSDCFSGGSRKIVLVGEGFLPGMHHSDQAVNPEAGFNLQRIYKYKNGLAKSKKQENLI